MKSNKSKLILVYNDPQVAIMARVSTDQQEREGTSLDTQIEQCMRQAELDGEAVNHDYVYREQWSGADINRPVLTLLRQAVQNGEIRVVYAYSPDRLSRDPLHLLTLMEEFASAGVELRFVRGFTEDTPEGRLMMYIHGYVGQRERLDFMERTMRGKMQTARLGRMPNGTGSGLYGYDYDTVNKVRVVNEKEAVVVRQAFQWCYEGWTTYRIALKLNEMGIPTKRGNRWHPLTVRRMLENPAYTGLHFYGQKRYRKVPGNKIEVTDRPESEWVALKSFTPPLISREIYQAVRKRQEVQQARTVDGERRYLLTGFGLCPTCGTTIVGTSLRHGYRYYRCRGTWRTSTRDAICKERYIPGDHLEWVVWTAVVDAIRDPTVLIADLLEHLSTGDGGLGAKMDELRREIRDLKSEQRRLIELRQKDLVDLDILETQIGPVKALCDEKEEALLLLEAQQQQNHDAEEAGRRIAQYCQAVSDKLDDLDLEGKRATLAAFGVKFEATRDRLSITVRIDPNCTTIARTLASPHARSGPNRPVGIRQGLTSW